MEEAKKSPTPQQEHIPTERKEKLFSIYAASSLFPCDNAAATDSLLD
jgi:hypothetical protein